MLCGNCCEACAVRSPDILDGGWTGLRAFCSRPKGVDEAVIGAVPWESDLREGRRKGWVFEDSGIGLAKGDSSSSSEVESGDCGLAAKSIASIESSWGILGAGAGGEAMVVPIFLSSWHEQIKDGPVEENSRRVEIGSPRYFCYQMPHAPVGSAAVDELQVVKERGSGRRFD